MREEVLFLTHKKSNRINNDIISLRDTSGERKLTVLAHSLEFNIKGVDHFLFNNSITEVLNYPTISDSITPGHAHFPLFHYFLKRQPESEFYWIIEYDVRFTGIWSRLFDTFQDNKTDFLTAHIRSTEDEPEWPWWELVHPEKEIPEFERLRSFNPVYRISKRALNFLHKEFKSGWRGHNEVLLISLLKHYGFTVGDINHVNSVPNGPVKFYSSKSNTKGKLLVGTHRHKPPMKNPGFRKNRIYHPVKEKSGVGRVRWFIGNAIRNFRMKIRSRR